MRFIGSGVVGVVLIVIVLFGFLRAKSPSHTVQTQNSVQPTNKYTSVPLAIETMRQRNYPGSDITIEDTLAPGSNYSQFIASYKSDGLKINALLTVPNGDKPKNGWPVIIFNHGYIPPEIYRTTERYIAYVDAFARNGYIVLKPDYRGNGQSEGQPEGAYYSPAYATDVLNALSSIKKYKDADSKRIGMWGHSMGGNITLRDIVVDPKDIKAAVIWGGVVGTYDELINKWTRTVPFQPSEKERALRSRQRAELIKRYGTPTANPDLWNAIDPTAHVADISAPVQIHYGTADEEVPPLFSQTLYDKLRQAGKTVEIYSYDGSDHNISQGFPEAMDRSVAFFDKYLK